MNSIVKKTLKILLVLVFSIIIIYLGGTIIAFNTWCRENQINMFLNSDELLLYLDSEKIQELGDIIGSRVELLENSLNEVSGDNHSLAEYYNSLGYSVWSYMQMGISEVLNRYIIISIVLGVSITIAYTVITSKKMNNILKIAVGYLGVILIVPQIFTYSITHNFNFAGDISRVYLNSNIIYFYIGYTAIFALMYIINYVVGVKMARKLNETIKNSQE